MRTLILTLIFIITLISFLANPAPEHLELLDVILLCTPFFLGILSFSFANSFKIYPHQFSLVFAISLYISYLLISGFMGLLQGVPLLQVLRSIGPYLNFLPLILLGFIPTRIITPFNLSLILILVALVQVSYLCYLYFSHTHQIHNTVNVLVNRITFLDQRTTLPFLLALPILPLLFFQKKTTSQKQFWFNSLGFSLILIGLLGGLITLTRSIFLAIVLSFVFYFILYFYQQARLQKLSLALIQFSKKIFIVLPLFLLIIFIMDSIPKIHLLITGLLSRFDHSNGVQTDYSNGRIYDEWLPALSTWAHSNILNWLFGIGAGNAFTLPTGETRTYIHNLSIYSLVYGGFWGLLSCFFLYVCLIRVLVLRAIRYKNIGYLAFSALVGSMFFYGQLFAVHKVLAFNLMLFLIITLALSFNEGE